MATDKVYKVVGVSKLDGEYKVRFANDLMRCKVLAKHGHEDIRLVELPEALEKYAAIQAIQSDAEFADAAAQDAILDYLTEKAPKTPKVKKDVVAAGPAVKAAGKKSKKETMIEKDLAALAEAAAVAKADAETEDEPF